VKIKIGEDWGRRCARDLERVRFARLVIGDDAQLYVDANGGYTRKQAVRVARQLIELGVSWFEEPVSSDDLEGLREVRDLVDVEVAAGEYGYDLAYYVRMLAAEAVDCLQVDVTRCGGITEFLRVAGLAAANGLQVSAHCAPAISVAPCAAVPNFRHLEFFADHERIEQQAFDGVLDPKGGVFRPDRSQPGAGLELKAKDIERFRRR
jgi:L-alanine-DL-glutamate epimerase-like enolase superfamily enzyme